MPGFRALAGARALAAAAITTLVVTITALPAAASITGGSVTCGGLIAYNSYKIADGLNASRVMAVPAPGGTPRAIWDRAGEGEIDPAWSPDGRSIAFVGRTPAGTTPEGFPAADTRLYVLRPGAAEPEVVVEQFAQRGGLRFPTWSPDGTRIAYATGVPPEGQDYQFLSWVHVVDVATKTDSFLTGLPDPVVVPPEAPRFRVAPALTWSPRGDRLLITAWEPGSGYWTIFSVRPDAADPQLTALISNDPSTDARIIAPMPTMFPAYLPGGQALLVEQESPDELSSRLYLTDTRFRHLVPVSAPTGWDSQPDFGRSPLQAVYQHYNDVHIQSSIAVLNLPTGASRTQVPAADGVLVEQPDWQPVLGCHPWPFRT